MADVDVKKTDIKAPIYPHYAIENSDGWGIEMLGIEAMDGSDIEYAGVFGLPIINFTIEAADILKARVRNKRGKWLPYKTGFGMNKAEALGDNTPITGIEIVGAGFIFSIHAKGGSWLPVTKTSDIEGDVLAVAASSIDAIWIDKI